jgi:hypothetical protein
MIRLLPRFALLLIASVLATGWCSTTCLSASCKAPAASHCHPGSNMPGQQSSRCEHTHPQFSNVEVSLDRVQLPDLHLLGFVLPAASAKALARCDAPRYFEAPSIWRAPSGASLVVSLSTLRI